MPEVQKAMIEAIKIDYGNPSSQHKTWDKASEALERARGSVARLINCVLSLCRMMRTLLYPTSNLREGIGVNAH